MILVLLNPLTYCLPAEGGAPLVDNLQQLFIEIYTQTTNLESLGGKVRKKIKQAPEAPQPPGH